jgi:Flp pilus assembly protein TadD
VTIRKHRDDASERRTTRTAHAESARSPRIAGNAETETVPPLLLAGVLALAFALRLAAVLWLSDTVPFSDGAYYHLAAQKMAADWKFPFERSQVEYYGKLGWWPPLYPAFLSLLYRLLGTHPRVVSYAQVVLGTLVVALVERIGRRAAGARVGLVAALLVAVDPTYVFLTNILASENLYVVWLAVGLLFAGRLLHDGELEGKSRTPGGDSRGSIGGTRRDAVLAGVAFALGALTRAIGLLVPVIVALASRTAASRRQWLMRSAWLVGASAIVIAPWTLRNTFVASSPALVCFGGGLNFYYGNNEVAIGYRDLAATPMAHLPTQAAIDRAGYELGLAYVARKPFTFFTHGAHKVIALFGSAGYAPHANSAILLPDGWQTDPVKGQQAAELRARQRAKNRWLDGPITQFANLHTALLVIGALLACLRWRRLPRALRLMVWICAYWILAHVVFWAQPRFRYPMEVPMALLTAFSLTGLVRGLTGRPRAMAAILPAILLAGCAVASYPPPPSVEPWGDPDHPYDDPVEVAATNALGPQSFEDQRQHPPAIRLGEFLLLDGTLRESRGGLARLLVSDGEQMCRLNGVDSLPLYLEAARVDPSYASAWVQAARVALARGSTLRAHALAAQGLRLDWNDANAWSLMASIYLREQDDVRARAALEYCLELDPAGLPGVAQSLAVLYVRAGEFARADSLAQHASKGVAPYLLPYLAGVQARENGDLEAARQAFREAARDSLAAPGVLVEWGNAEHVAGDLDAAESAYRRALSIEPGLPAALLGLGVVERARGQFEAACATFTALLQRDPRHAAAQYDLGGAALEAAHAAAPSHHADSLYAVAEHAFATSADLGFRVSEARLWSAEAQLQKGDSAGAYEHALALVGDPQQAAAARMLAARAAQAAGRPTDVIAVLAPAFQSAALGPGGLDLLGNAYLKLGRSAEAVPVLQQAHERQPNDWRTAVNLGIALAQTDRTEEAETLLRSFADRYPNEPIILQNLAVVLQRRGERVQAAELLRRAEALRSP